MADYVTIMDGNKEKRVFIEEYKGKTYLHIREFYEDKNSGEMKPGKGGTINPDLASELISAIKKVYKDHYGEEINE